MHGVAESDRKANAASGADAVTPSPHFGWCSVVLFGLMRWESIGSLARLQQVQQLQATCAAMTQIPLSIEQTVAPQPKRSTATKLVVGLLGVFAVVCVYQQGHQAWGASRVAVSPLHVADRLQMRAYVR